MPNPAISPACPSRSWPPTNAASPKYPEGFDAAMAAAMFVISGHKHLDPVRYPNS